MILSRLLFACFLTLSPALLFAHAGETHGSAQETQDHVTAIVAKRAWLQNYYTLAWMLTPGGPIIPYKPGSGSISAEIAYLPYISKTRQIGDKLGKVEDTNLSPVVPRFRFKSNPLDIGPISTSIGLAFLPPIPNPIGFLFSLAGEVAVGWRSDFGLNVGARFHMHYSHVRAEIAKPESESEYVDAAGNIIDNPTLVENDSEADTSEPEAPPGLEHDHNSTLGGDIGVSYRFPFKNWDWLTVFANFGLARVYSMFWVGDGVDHVIRNEVPWKGFNISTGIQTLFFNDQLMLSVEYVMASPFKSNPAHPLFQTGKFQLGYVW